MVRAQASRQPVDVSYANRRITGAPSDDRRARYPDEFASAAEIEIEYMAAVGMVASFSIGLALTLVAVGMTAALGLRYANGHLAGFERFMASAPYVSGALILLVGVYMAMSGYGHVQ